MLKVPKRYWQIAKRLTTAQLQKESANNQYINELELFNVDIGKRGHGFLLGYYSKEGIKLALEKYGIIEYLHSIGFKNLMFEVDTSDAYVHKLSIFDKIKDGQHLLVELVLKKKFVTISMPFKTPLNGKKLELLAIEWMCLQNPATSFNEQKKQLPGQKYPGLGMASKAVELLIIMAWRLKLGGLANTPDHFHNAYLYSKIFFYQDPKDQAKLQALARDTEHYPLHVVAWAMEWGLVQDKIQNEPVLWQSTEQIVPLDNQLKNIFNSNDYRRLVKKYMKQYKFELDYQAFKNKMRSGYQ
ncbi:MAG: hypothetical protein GF313_08860 [Caldithrix sp.]|nr:hypothetical protein [Caldithrix sp.]